MSTVWALITSLPEILKLIQSLEKIIVEAETQRKVSDDLKTLHQAIEAKDASKINALFASDT